MHFLRGKKFLRPLAFTSRAPPPVYQAPYVRAKKVGGSEYGVIFFSPSDGSEGEWGGAGGGWIEEGGGRRLACTLSVPSLIMQTLLQSDATFGTERVKEPRQARSRPREVGVRPQQPRCVSGYLLHRDKGQICH